MLQLGRELDLAPETLHVHPGSQLGKKHLYHDLAAEGALESKEHPGHAPAPELALQEVCIS
jgi:hypothetical protein